MFEFDQYERRLRDAPPVRGATGYRPLADVAALSFMWWSEHCVECADPDCYTTCDLYQPRSDGRCRRFAYGLYRNRGFPSLRGYGAEAVFKTWAKLEADGNTWMEPRAAVLRRERWLGMVGPLARTLSGFAERLTGDPRWRARSPSPRKIARRLHRRGNGRRLPDAFVVEVYNPEPNAVKLQLGMRIPLSARLSADRPVPAPFHADMTLEPGYSCHRFDRHRFGAIVGCGLPFKVTVTPEADETTRLVFLGLDFVCDRASREGQPGAPVKCVVFDLDNTLWDGVLVEDERVRPKENVVEVIRTLDARGVLVSVASKNDHARAWRRLEEIGLADCIIEPQISWLPKSVGIRRLADRLNLGLDAFAFVDDSPFERAEVAAALPEVVCLAAEKIDTLPDDARFRGSGSADARNRRQYYRVEKQRNQQRSEWGSDYLGFLRDCQIVLTVGGYVPGDFDRVSELVQRTNQLNFSGHKYTRHEMAEILEAGPAQKFVLRCEDRYGSYGTVGFALVRKQDRSIVVDDFMLSCRVQGRFVEKAFFAFLAGSWAGGAVDRLVVRFRPTDRNGPARTVLEGMGFQPVEAEQGLVLGVSGEVLRCELIRVVGEGPGLSAAPARGAKGDMAA